jgi:AcrR family transcriptional regulator
MTTRTRKQREREKREDRILDVARTMVLENGYLGLNMDRVAESVEYSKGTIYQHFASKEDMLLAVVIRDLQARLRLFRMAVDIGGRTRERLAALITAHEVFETRFPRSFQIEQLIRGKSLWKKASPERRSRFDADDLAAKTLVSDLVSEAVAKGEVTLIRRTPDEVLYGLLTMALGAHLLSETEGFMRDLEVTDREAALRLNVHTFLDGLEWRPLQSEFDYDVLHRRVLAEVFEAETG